MTDWKRKKLWLEKGTGQVYMAWKALYGKQLKTTAVRKKLKTMGYVTPTIGQYPRNG